MSEGTAGTPARAPKDEGAVTDLCILFACFAGRSQAAKTRRELGKRIVQSGDAILDEVVVTISSKRRTLVYDPRRTLAGVLTPALTWGVFGLLAGGLRSLVVWAVLGAVCGGLYAYYFEHLLAKDELRRIGGRLPGDSSAIVAFVRGPDPRRILSTAAALQPVTVSVAAVAADLSGRVYLGAAPSKGATVTRDGAAPDTGQGAELSMLLVRFAGEHTARQTLVTVGSSPTHQDQNEPQVELVIETNPHGSRRVVNPTTGSAAVAKSDAISWGLFGLVWGVIVGFTGDGGILGSIESGLVTGILWALFGVVAGALYGLWAGRGLSAGRLKRLGAFVPPATSLVVAWAEGSPDPETIERWAGSESRRLTLRFTPAGHGAVLEM
ncbi:hypothetical protein ACIBG5_08635 [Kribbella sp. NPDC050241]|uniref:hypothetical protein n=1 Tax=Kribbella sp. NPDC050241 TaxID=3364115 RepID=UPI0037A560AC